MNKIATLTILIALVSAGVTVGICSMLKPFPDQQLPLDKMSDTQNAAITDVGDESAAVVPLAAEANGQDEQDANLASQFIISTVDLGSSKSDANGVVSGTISNLTSMSPGMHIIEFKGEGMDGKPLVNHVFFNIAGRPQAGSVYGVYFNIFNPKNDHDNSEIVDVVYENKNYATLSPDENGGIFVQFPIATNQDKFEATAKSRDTGKIMKVTVGVDRTPIAETGSRPSFEEGSGGSSDGYIVVINGREAGGMPIGVFSGEQVHIQAGPFKPNSQIRVWPEDFESVTSGEDGFVDEMITMPDLAPGVHKIEFSGDCPSGAGIGLEFSVVYPLTDRVSDGSYGIYLTGFTPDSGDYDSPREEVKIGYIGTEFEDIYPDEYGGVFFALPTFGSSQSKIEFTVTGSITGKTVQVSIDNVVR